MISRTPPSVVFSYQLEMPVSIEIRDGGIDDPQVQDLLRHHLATARAETGNGSAHALEVDALRSTDMSFWSAWEGGRLLGVGALKRLSETHGEVKSMHTDKSYRRSGVGSALLGHIISVASASGIGRLSLETGAWPYFEPARTFYKNHGFAKCAPFADYKLDENSVFMTLDLQRVADRRSPD